MTLLVFCIRSLKSKVSQPQNPSWPWCSRSNQAGRCLERAHQAPSCLRASWCAPAVMTQCPWLCAHADWRLSLHELQPAAAHRDPGAAGQTRPAGAWSVHSRCCPASWPAGAPAQRAQQPLSSAWPPALPGCCPVPHLPADQDSLRSGQVRSCCTEPQRALIPDCCRMSPQSTRIQRLVSDWRPLLPGCGPAPPLAS